MSSINTYSSHLMFTAATLTNAYAPSLHDALPICGVRTIDAQLDNQGTLTVNQPLSLSHNAAARTNSGTIDMSAADFTLTQVGAAPSFTNTGTVTLGAGHLWTINNGTLNQNGGGIA